MIFNACDENSGPTVGAVRAGEAVRFCVRPQEDVAGAMLSVYEDGQGSPSLFSMDRIGDRFELAHTFDKPGLYFYGFAVADAMGVIKGSREHEPAAARSGNYHQLTVYAEDYIQPQGWIGGVMYQIFPDRFNIGDGIVQQTPYAERRIHTDLGEAPDFRPDASGRVLNRDYFGGNLLGIQQKLEYLNGLGVTCVYLNPICEAHSNHRYDTADYLKVDPLLGTEQDFIRLCKAAHRKEIRIILDGVFSHTGADSVYFNRDGRYAELGAYQSELSDYYGWYKFEHYPDRYKSWWGFESLPEIDEYDPSFISFVCDEHGVIDTWMGRGADGFRLDVADELPDEFIAQIRASIKRHGDDKLLLGEVWEDASNKVSYGVRRRYFQGDELDAVMNYPFRTAILDFVRDGDAGLFAARTEGIVRNYPKPMLDLAMNMLSTHDTERAITALVAGEVSGRDREWQHAFRLDRDGYLRGVEMLKLAMVLQFTLPGIPCIYYGDEIGMQGMRDPFNRGFMQWDSADENLLAFTKQLSGIRRGSDAFADGDFKMLYAKDGMVVFERAGSDERFRIALNRADSERAAELPDGTRCALAPWSYEIAKI